MTLASYPAEARVQQQRDVADLAHLVLAEEDLGAVFDAAAHRLSETLGAPFASVFRHEPGAARVRLIAGTGWSAGVVGATTLPAFPGTLPAEVLAQAEPVVVSEADPHAVAPPALITGHGLRSCICAAIPSGIGAPFGILGLHHTRPDAFGEDDVLFVQSVALVLGGAVAQARARATIEQQMASLESYFEAVPVGVAILDAEHRYVRVNARLAALAGTTAEALVGQHAARVNPAYPTVMEPYVARVLRTGVPVLNHEVRIGTGADPDTELDWLVSFVPVGAPPEAVSVVVQDVTPLRRAQTALEQLTERLEARVAERTQQVRRLLADLTTAEQRERRTVARTLHDDLQQQLVAVQMRLQLLDRIAADGGDVRPALAAATTTLGQAIETTRGLTLDLSPPVLAGEGVERSLEWLAERMEAVHGLRTTVCSEGDTQAAPDVQTLLFQLVRELLVNVVRHSGQAEATVRVTRLDGHLRIAVTDAGSGFDPARLDAPDGDGLGLVSVRERLGLIGGTLRIASGSNGGTTVTLEIPAFP